MSFLNKTNHIDTTEIWLKVVLNTDTPELSFQNMYIKYTAIKHHVQTVC